MYLGKTKYDGFKSFPDRPLFLTPTYNVMFYQRKAGNVISMCIPISIGASAWKKWV